MTDRNVRKRAGETVGGLLTRFERNIADGLWQVGTKIPTERELEQELGVSRNTLRKGLRQLEEQGRIERHVGRGSFVADPSAKAPMQARPFEAYKAAVAATAIIRPKEQAEDGGLIDQIRGASPSDVMDVRLMIEPAAAELATYRASAENFTQIQNCLDRMRAAADVPEFEHWDSMLHVAIMSAARNDLLLTMYKAINEARNQPEWMRLKQRSLSPAQRDLYQQQHVDIVGALMDRDPVRAREFTLAHLRAVRDNLQIS